MPDLPQDGQASAEFDPAYPKGVRVTPEMCAAGASEYRDWESDSYEQNKLNSVADLVSSIYRAMEVVHRASE